MSVKNGFTAFFETDGQQMILSKEIAKALHAYIQIVLLHKF